MPFAATDNRPIGGDRIAAGEALTDTLPEPRGRPHRFCRSELAYPKTAGWRVSAGCAAGAAALWL